MNKPSEPIGERRYRWSRFPVGEGLAGGLGFCVAALLSLGQPFAPTVHDEFSYLLAADTLLHGRLANPAPDVWQPLQTFHVIVQPSYTSKYPLGPALLIALGWLLFSHPLAGSWLAAGLCAAGMTWMLRALVASRWAVLGGLLVAAHPTMQSTWSISLISGWLPAFAATLVTGGALRLRRRIDCWPAVILGSGVACLALTRPFEGLVTTLLSVLGLVVYWLVGRPPADVSVLKITRALSCAGVPVLLAFSLIGAQNLAVSGSWNRMPYQLHEQYYGVAPLFIFGNEKRGSLERTHDVPEVVENYHHGWSLDCFQARQGYGGWLTGMWQAVWLTWNFWSLLPLVLVFTLFIWGRYAVCRWLACAIGFQLACSSLVCWIYPHYLAPILPWCVALSIVGCRHFSRWAQQSSFRSQNVQPAHLPTPNETRRRPPAGQLALYGLVILQVGLLGLGFCRREPVDMDSWPHRRVAIARELQSAPGKHLVLVRYSQHHNVHEEWVYNLANIDSAKVLWARDERQDWTSRFLHRYADDRTIWLLEPDSRQPDLKLVTRPAVQAKHID